MKFVFRVAIAGLIATLIGGSAVLSVSASSLPGDTLYMVKRSWEQVRSVLFLDSESRSQYLTQLEQTRREEIRRLLDMRRTGEVEFEGLVASMDDPQAWIIGGFLVRITDQTQIEGAFSPGMEVRVRASVQGNGDLLALWIRPVSTGENPTQPVSTPTSTEEATPTPLPVLSGDETPTPLPFPGEDDATSTPLPIGITDSPMPIPPGWTDSPSPYPVISSDTPLPIPTCTDTPIPIPTTG